MDPIAKDLGQFRVKLGERSAQGALARRVGAAAEVTGYGERGVAKKISHAGANSHFAIRLLSRLPGPLQLPCRAARETEWSPLTGRPGEHFPLQRDAL